MTDVYTNAKYLAATDQLEWNDGGVVFRAMLMVPAYSYSAAHIYVSDISASEVAHASYARQGVGSRTVTLDLGGARALLDAGDVTFPAVTGFTAGSMVIYKQVGVDDTTPADDPLVCYILFGSAQTPANQSVRIEFAAGGVFTLTAC